jgi:hypothetical protein
MGLVRWISTRPQTRTVAASHSNRGATARPVRWPRVLGWYSDFRPFYGRLGMAVPLRRRIQR